MFFPPRGFGGVSCGFLRWQNELGELQSGSGRCGDLANYHVVEKNSFLDLVEEKFRFSGFGDWSGGEGTNKEQWWCFQENGETMVKLKSFGKGLEGYVNDCKLRHPLSSWVLECFGSVVGKGMNADAWLSLFP